MTPSRDSPRARPPHTRTDIGALLTELALLRAQGFAIIDHEVELGLRSMRRLAPQELRNHRVIGTAPAFCQVAGFMIRP